MVLGTDLEPLDEQALVVAGLAPGRYELKVDGRAVATFSAEDLGRGVNLARSNTPMRWQAYSVKWSAEAGHDLQVLRRGLLVDAAKDPSLQAAAETLAARDEAAQKQRSADATPRPHTYALIPDRGHPGGPGGVQAPRIQEGQTTP